MVMKVTFMTMGRVFHEYFLETATVCTPADSLQSELKEEKRAERLQAWPHTGPTNPGAPLT
jgi:predicted HicB family RNase H-like nuclease